MPFTRPAEISDGVSLSDKVGRSIAGRGFVSEYGAVDAGLSAVVDELSPHKEGISVAGPENNVFSWSDKLASLSSVLVLVGAIVSLI